MASVVRDKLIVETFRLSRAAPQLWQEFEAAFRAYVLQLTEESVRAAPDIALVSHGRAQSLLALRDDFAQIEQLALAVQNKLNRQSR